MSEEKPVIRADRADGLCTLTLNRPDALNALSTPLVQELEAHIADIAAKPDKIGCVVVRGSGRSFCAGADLKEISAKSGSTIPNYKAKVLEKLANLPQPTIAATHGHCFTGGLELAVCCDFLFAKESCQFADTHGKWGMVAAWGLSQRLPRRIGATKAKEMAFTARRYTAKEALAMGLISFCVPDDRFEEELDKLVKDILANSWHTNRGVKKMLADTDGLPLSAGLAHEIYRSPGPAPDQAQRLAGFAKKQ